MDRGIFFASLHYVTFVQQGEGGSFEEKQSPAQAEVKVDETDNI